MVDSVRPHMNIHSSQIHLLSKLFTNPWSPSRQPCRNDRLLKEEKERKKEHGDMTLLDDIINVLKIPWKMIVMVMFMIIPRKFVMDLMIIKTVASR